MKNLKKVLALVMAFAMAFTMMAGAAFTDSADIEATEAVDTLSALGVINGYEDGSFQPNGTVTRAEMAAMIYIVRNGGKTDASGYENLPTSFTDIKGHWAEGFIKHAQTMGIISGRNDKTFDPNAKVTGVEAALMCLRTAGYDAAKAGIGGATWANKTLSLANEAGLLDDVKADLASACPRQWAAQLIFNLLDTDCVTWSNDSETFEKHDRGGKAYGTVGEKYMDLKTTVGTLDTVSKESGKDTYKLTIGETENTADDSTKPLETSFSKVTKDYSALLDREVKVLYKEKDEVYGVFATEDSDVLTGILGDFEKSDSKLKFDGTKYSVGKTGDDDTNLVKENGTKASSNANDIVAYVDAAEDLSKVFPASTRTQDDKIVALNVKTLSIAKVTYVGKDYINATKKAGANFDKIDTDSANYPSDLKKDDYIAIYDADNFADDKMLVEKLDVVEGKITSTKNAGKDDYSVMIDGTWYEQAIDTSNGSAYQPIELKDEVAIVVKDGYFVCVDDADAGAKDVALLVKAVEKTSASDDTIEGRLIFADGTDKTVNIKDTKMFDPDPDSNPQTDDAEALPFNTPTLVSYKKSGDKYELTKVDGVVSGYDAYAKDATKVEDDKLNGTIKYINNDATVFVRYNDGDDFSVITGKALKNWSASKTFTSQVLSKKSNGMQYASVAFINLGTDNMSGGKDTTYGYVLEASQITTEDDKDYTTTLVWNGTDEITLKVEDGEALAEGQVVEYSTNSDETHNIDKTYTLDLGSEDADNKALTRGVVTGFDYDAEKIEGTLTGFKAKSHNGDWIASSSNEITLNISNDDHDSVVLFVDTDGPSGVADGEFQTAAENNDGKKLANIAYYADGNNVKIVIVDTQNKYAK